MIQTKVVVSSSQKELQEGINEVLAGLYDDEFVDIKVAGSYGGKYETFMAVVVYKVERK